MRNLSNLVFFHAKRLVSNLSFTSLTLFMPLVFIIFFAKVNESDSVAPTSEIAVINHSDWISQVVQAHMQEENTHYFTEDRSEAFQQLEERELAIVYEIPENYPEQSIIAYSLNGENRDPVWEADLIQSSHRAIEHQVLNHYQIDPASLNIEAQQPTLNFMTKGIEDDLILMAIMITLYMGMGAMVTTADLEQLRSQQVLKRGITANSNSWLVLGSLLLGYSLAMLFNSFMTMLISCLVLNISLANLAPLLIIILSMAFFYNGLMIFLFRYIKDSRIILGFGFLIPTLMFIMTFIGKELDQFEMIKYLSPFHWVFQYIDRGDFWTTIPIVLLYAGVLFTAGSFKVERLLANKK
ncbi:hypothetical protein HZY91_08670 [Facklamia sp. DSM 111018]|uniref:ABC-2 type transporter transmembrane domain-containing protein n=1 Tax=Facklamia lactis TaxID=2749967 RepID=A0ABS0LS19_9LACT|nr:ABC transporter permease [Facklamia lactis]MBG9981159.1 hypothetical protein [Facklamia lactis]MBG9986960.1 hypothetical protein [Facklamia lactis]